MGLIADHCRERNTVIRGPLRSSEQTLIEIDFELFFVTSSSRVLPIAEVCSTGEDLLPVCLPSSVCRVKHSDSFLFIIKIIVVIVQS